MSVKLHITVTKRIIVNRFYLVKITISTKTTLELWYQTCFCSFCYCRYNYIYLYIQKYTETFLWLIVKSLRIEFKPSLKLKCILCFFKRLLQFVLGDGVQQILSRIRIFMKIHIQNIEVSEPIQKRDRRSQLFVQPPFQPWHKHLVHWMPSNIGQEMFHWITWFFAFDSCHCL